MYSSINFLKERNRLQEIELIRDKRIALITAVVLGVFLTIVVLLFGYQVFLSAQLEKLKTASVGEQQQLTSLNSIQSAYLVETQKVQTIAKVFQTRGNKWDVITFFYGLLPPGNSIGSVDLKSGVENSLDFSVQSDSVFSYAKLADVLQSPAVASGGYKFTLGSLSRDRTGKYSTSITVLFNQKTK